MAVRPGDDLAKRSRGQRPDGVFCANDLLAVGILQSFTMLARLQIPGDMALVGYDDIDFASATVVPLTSIRQLALLIGRTAVDLLMSRSALVPTSTPRAVVFQPELIIRDSSRRRP